MMAIKRRGAKIAVPSRILLEAGLCKDRASGAGAPAEADGRMKWNIVVN